MRDRFFFALAAVVAGVFVTMALQPWADRPPSGPVSAGGRNAEDVTITGKELHRFVPGNYDGISFVTDAGEPVLRITQLGTDTYDEPRSGPHILLDSDLENAFESRPIEVEIVARAAPDFAAEQFKADYFARSEGESGWQVFNLTRDWQAYRFQFTVPKIGAEAGYDYVAIVPVTPDQKRRVMDVKSLRIHAIGPKQVD